MTQSINSVIQKVANNDDLSVLTEEEKGLYYNHMCENYQLNPASKPFAYITFDSGKEVLYALKSCTDQLRKMQNISVTIISREKIKDDVYLVVARATMDGRTDDAIGAVPLKDWRGEPLSPSGLANAMMHAETKAKRRATLSITGVSLLDESEVKDMKKEEGNKQQQGTFKRQGTQQQPRKEQNQNQNNDYSSKEINWKNKQKVQLMRCKKEIGNNEIPYYTLSFVTENKQNYQMFAVQNLASAIEKLQPKEGVEFMVTAKNTQKGLLLTSISA